MKKTSLNELLGSSGESAKAKEFTLKDLPDLLGERMPKIEYSPVGRLRLTQALRKRFGDDYRNLPGISSLLKQFDDEASFNVKLQEMKMIKAKRD